LVSLLITAPITAYAQSVHRVGIRVAVGATGEPNRFPSSKGADFSMAATSAGIFLSDVTSCYRSKNHYDTRLRRDRSWLPDQTVSQILNRGFCAGVARRHSVSWSGGRFHFDVNAYQYNVRNGRGWDSTYWPS